MAKANSTTPTMESAPAAPAEAEATQLTMADIQGFVSVIDIASQRGAFRGEEMSQVGGLRDRVTSFLKAAQEAQTANASPGGEPVSENAADTTS